MDRITTYINFARLMVERDLRIYRATRMSKFSEVAAGMAKRQKAWDDRASAILTGMEKLDPKADAAFAKHEAKLVEAETGFKSMEDAVRDLEGGNNPPTSNFGGGAEDPTS